DSLDSFSVAGIQHACRHAQNAPKFVGNLGIADEDLVVHGFRIAIHVEMLALYPWLNDFGAFVIHSHAEDHKPLRAVFLMELDQPRYFRAAWRAPGSPEVY